MGKLFIIDMMPFLYKGHFVFLRNPRMTSTGINTSALLGLASGLQSILKREKPTHAVLAMDPGGPTFRHRAYAPYKAQRQKMPEDLAASIPYAFELAEALRIPVVRVDDFEADDVMGTLAVKGAAAGFDVYMATPDKDAAQLVRPGVKLYRPAHAGDAAEIYDEAKVCEHWHLREPRQMIDYLALAGDASDNIPGIRGVGEKTAADLLSRRRRGDHRERGLPQGQARGEGRERKGRRDDLEVPDDDPHGRPDRTRLGGLPSRRNRPRQTRRGVREVRAQPPREGAARR